MKNLWAWVDIETTGLNDLEDVVLEVAVVITDPELNILDKVETLVTYADLNLDLLSDFVKKMHTDNGLISELKSMYSPLHVAERKLIDFFSKYFHHGSEELPAMCGSGVHFDRRFLNQAMPSLASRFHYRNIDVSTVRRLIRDWLPDVTPYVQPLKHRAMPDVLDSIAELKYYRRFIRYE